jgi:dolichol-phosphate mannosyltransferase
MPQLSVIVPTFNELGNVVELRNRVAEALTGIDWEMIFVDDNSPDGTAQAVREMAQADRRVRCIQHRPPRALHRLHRGHAGLVRARRRRDRRRPAA